jgi:hypothetical protein
MRPQAMLLWHYEAPESRLHSSNEGINFMDIFRDMRTLHNALHRSLEAKPPPAHRQAGKP